jgi:hypothetical protein
LLPIKGNVEETIVDLFAGKCGVQSEDAWRNWMKGSDLIWRAKKEMFSFWVISCND